jgi:Tol biopolymer transport system component
MDLLVWRRLAKAAGVGAVFTAAVLTLTAASMAQTASTRPSAFEVQETRLGPWDPAKGGFEPVFSSDGRHVAYLANRGGHIRVVVDGQVASDGHGSVEYYAIDPISLIFSPDGRRLAYPVYREKGGKEFLVADGKVGAGYKRILRYSLRFSPDGNRLAYVAAEGTKQVVVLDGRAGNEYDSIDASSLCFSPNSKHFEYSATNTGKDFVMLDGRPILDYDAVGQPIFSPS